MQSLDRKVKGAKHTTLGTVVKPKLVIKLNKISLLITTIIYRGSQTNMDRENGNDKSRF